MEQLKEYISKNLNVPFVYLKDKQKYLCANGVLFSKEEYLNGIDLQSEYAKREKSNQLYDYVYAKNTGVLRKKRRTSSLVKIEDVPKQEENLVSVTAIKSEVHLASKTDNSVKIICVFLAFTSAISMYISTLHTATYLSDYVGLISAWLMSTSVTAYNGTAFEVSVLFHSKKRNLIAIVFMLLWVFVTLFSMTTTVSVFYDRYNFNEAVVANENMTIDSSKLQLEMLQKKESDLRESISFKRKDIEYRQEREWATTAVRNELTKLEEKLQKNLEEQRNILSIEPNASKEMGEVQRKETLFAFLGRILHMEGGVLEFIMSTLSAIFVNLIAPLSLSAVTELLYRKEDKDLTN